MTRFLIVPVVEEDTARGPSQSPKYIDRDGLTGVRGQIVDVSDLPLPVDVVYAAWFSGDAAALDEIADEVDVFDATPYLAQIVAALNERFGRDNTLDQWLDSFGV